MRRVHKLDEEGERELILASPFSAEELFLELSEEPLGAASLAQCHQGVLRDSGKVVAVKIQHPDVKKNADTDMDMIDVSAIFLP